MYGASQGELSLDELMAAEYSPSVSSSAAPSGTLQASPGEIYNSAKITLNAVQGLVNASPNMELVRHQPSLDFSKPPMRRHTRSANVVAVAQEVFAAPSVSDGQAAIEYANKWIHYGGAEEGWLARVKARGCGSKALSMAPDVKVSMLAFAEKCFPLNRVSKINLINSFYKPDLQSSAGLPNINSSKADVWPALRAELAKVNQEPIDLRPITGHSYWPVAVLKLKAELHETAKLGEKARGYCVFPALTSMTLGSFLAHFTKQLPTIVDNPTSTSLVGISFYHGGAQRFLDWVEATPMGDVRAAYYGDDCIIVARTMANRLYFMLPDVSAMDMNTPSAFAPLWLEHIAQHWQGQTTAQMESFQALMGMYKHLLCDADYVLPRGVVVKWRNFATTGLAGNTHYQTFVNTVVWGAFIQPVFQQAMAASEPGASTDMDRQIVRAAFSVAAGRMQEVGLEWKVDTLKVSRFKGKIVGILGQTLVRDKLTKQVDVGIPVGRLLASLLNPSKTPSKGPTAVFVAYARSVALGVCGGYRFPAWQALVKKLRGDCLKIAPVLQPEHRVALASLYVKDELGLGGSEVNLGQVFALDADGYLVVKKPPKWSKIRALVRDPVENSVESIGEQLAKLFITEAILPAKMAIPSSQPGGGGPAVMPWTSTLPPPGSSRSASSKQDGNSDAAMEDDAKPKRKRRVRKTKASSAPPSEANVPVIPAAAGKRKKLSGGNLKPDASKQAKMRASQPVA